MFHGQDQKHCKELQDGNPRNLDRTHGVLADSAGTTGTSITSTKSTDAHVAALASALGKPWLGGNLNAYFNAYHK